MKPDELERYARQIVLREVGGVGQQALRSARVLIVGAGGLGGPAGLYLAAGGIGHIGIIDHDVVALSNLHRQIQFRTHDVDTLKTTAMRDTLNGVNPHVQINEYPHKLDADNAQSILKNYDLVLDGTDNFQTRFLVNATCLANNTPLISGALGRFDGQVAAFRMDGRSACYQCFVPSEPPEAQTCANVGVMGALPGIIGSMMAMEAIKIITNAGDPLYGKIFLYDALSATARTITLPKDPNCSVCGGQ